MVRTPESRDDLQAAGLRPAGAAPEADESALPADCWAIVELMGHRRHAGRVREVELAGAKFLRLDVPGEGPGEVLSTHFYGGPAVYCLTPTTEEVARRVAALSRPAPVQRWELPAPPAVTGPTAPEEDDPEDGDEPEF